MSFSEILYKLIEKENFRIEEIHMSDDIEYIIDVLKKEKEQSNLK